MDQWSLGVEMTLRRLFDGFAIKIDEDFPLAPTDALNPLRCNQDFFPRPPVVGVNNEITNRPSIVVNDEILNVAKLAVHSLDMMTAHTVSAAQIGVPSYNARCGSRLLPMVSRCAVTDKIWKGTPTVGTAPIGRIIIMPIIGLLKLVRDRFVGVQGRAFFDLLFGQIHADVLFFLIYRLAVRIKRRMLEPECRPLGQSPAQMGITPHRPCR